MVIEMLLDFVVVVSCLCGCEWVSLNVNWSMWLMLICEKIDCCMVILWLVLVNIWLFIDEYLFFVFLCMMMKLMLLGWCLVSGVGMFGIRCIGCRFMY